MRITFSTTNYVTSFKGINDAVNKIRAELQNGTSGLRGDTFTKFEDGGTVIIENYYENGKSSDIRPQNSKGGAAVEGAVSGTTTGSAIEGTKSVAEKIKGNSEEAKQVDSVDSDDSTSVDLSGENDAENAASQSDIDNNFETASELKPNIDSELDMNFDPGLDIEPEIGIDPDLDIDPEVDIDPEIDIDIDF